LHDAVTYLICGVSISTTTNLSPAMTVRPDFYLLEMLAFTNVNRITSISRLQTLTKFLLFFRLSVNSVDEL